MIESWIESTLKANMKGNIAIYAIGNWFFSFLFELCKDRAMIFCNGPYFLGSWGMYLSNWTLVFNPDEDVPTIILVWVKLPRLSLSCWINDYLRVIGNGVGKHTNKFEVKELQFSCVNIFGGGLGEGASSRS